MDNDDAGPSDAGSVSGYSELGSISGSISSQLPTSDTLGYAAMMLAEAELRLEGATRQEQETDAMLLLAKREHPEKWYQERWCREQDGQVEVVLPDKTRRDCVTDTLAIEFDFGLPDSCTRWRFSYARHLRAQP